MRRIPILGRQEAAPPPTLYVPSGHEDVIVGRCTVPGCGARFYRGEEAAWQKHVGPCARANLDRIHEMIEQKSPAAFREDNWDPEVAAHMRQVGKRMLEEGRLEVKPHERAGHS